MEACGGAHEWGRALIGLGHEVRLISPRKVRPFEAQFKAERVEKMKASMERTVIAVDIAKKVFQLHWVEMDQGWPDMAMADRLVATPTL
jgi:hypothetical protein